MKWRVITMGPPRLSYAQLGVAEYCKRLRKYTTLELVHLKETITREASSSMLRASEQSLRIVLDERGENWTTDQFVSQVNQWEISATKSISILLGGAEGHTDLLRQQANILLSLGAMTLQHELALVTILEQLYRVYTIKRGAPYHRS